MSKKINIKELASDVAKTGKNLLDNVVQSADQNDDGKFNLEDVSVIAKSVGNSVKQGTLAIKDSVSEQTRLLELKTLQPIFLDALDSTAFLMPKFIRITDRDKKYVESEVCKGSIGYTSNTKGFQYVNIFRDSVDSFGLTFYPDCDCEFYYVDPSDRDKYIALDEYFGYLKTARVNELQKIAQDLGAKYFKVTYKEEQTSFSEKKTKRHVSTKGIIAADAELNSTVKKYSTVEITAEMEFPGHTPIKPQLKYMQRDPSIQTLVAMRMDESAPLINQKYMLKMSNSSGMKEADAAKIDGVLRTMKISGNATVSSEAKNEARRYLEYEIRF